MSFAIEVPGAAVPLSLADMHRALEAGNARDHTQREAAVQQLEAWQTQANYFASLQTAFLDRTLALEMRLLAIILFKNGIDKHWRTAVRAHAQRLPAEEKALIRSRLLQGTVDEDHRALALHNALATAKIVRIDYPQEWPEALPEIIAVLRATKDASPARLYGALTVLLRVIKELGTARLRRSQTALHHVAEELFFLLGDIYTGNTAAWMEYLQASTPSASASAPALTEPVRQAMDNSLLALKVLRHLVVSGFEYPHRSKLVQEFWTLSQTHFEQFLGYFHAHGGAETESDTDAKTDASATVMVGKHLLKFAKLHLDVSESHPASFAALPNSVALVRGYWGLVAGFADVYKSSGGLRQNASGGGKASAKLDGPLVELLALRGLLLLKSCLQIISQPLQTFKYRSPEAQAEQNAGVTRLKLELFTDEFVLQVVDTIISRLFTFRESDLDAWNEGPEEWELHESEAGAAWEWQVRPCAEKVFLSLFLHYKKLLSAPLLRYFQLAMSDDVDVLTKEAVYTAMCNSAAAVDAAFDYSAFVQGTLVRDVQTQGPLAKILRRRVAILLGAWSFYDLTDAARRDVYSIYAHLFNRADAANDEVVRLTAARQLKTTVDDYKFRAADFEPHAATVFAALIDLLQEVEGDETKLAVLGTMRTYIERLETIAARFSDGVMGALPGIWASEAADTYMIKQSVLSIFAALIMALGPASRAYHALTFPLIADALDRDAPLHQFLNEEATELWHSVLSQSEAPLDAALVALLPRALEVLDYDSGTAATALQIVAAYVVLAPRDVLGETHRRPTLTALLGAMQTKRWEQLKAAAVVVQNMVLTAHLLGGAEGVAVVARDMMACGLLPRILEQLHAVHEAAQTTGPNAKPSPLRPTTQVEYVLILARLALADPGTFVELLASVPGGLSATWAWLAPLWFATFDHMSAGEYHKVSCLAITRLLEVEGAMSDLVLAGNLQDYFSMWTAAVSNAQGGSTQPDYYRWAEGAPAPTEYDTPLMTAESRLAAQDPLHTETTYDYVLARLQALVARVGGDAAFEANYAVNVDRDVLASFRGLTTLIVE